MGKTASVFTSIFERMIAPQIDSFASARFAYNIILFLMRQHTVAQYCYVTIRLMHVTFTNSFDLF